MPLFSRPPAQPDRAAEELARLGVRLDAVAALLQRHVDAHADLPARVSDLPAQVWERILAESRNASAAAVAAAAASFRRHAWEELSKWAWRACLGYLGVQALQYANNLATGLHHAGAGVTP